MIIEEKKTICLNMIVKDEAHVITETLDNLTKFIEFDYWVISDTGSTDGTQELIKNYFKEKNIDGELFENKWKDFAYNRNKAIEQAYNKSDYLFFFDADDLIQGDFKMPTSLDKDAYEFIFGGNFCYNRICLVNNREKICEYEGVLHEYLNVYKQHFTKDVIRGNYHFESRRLGSRNHNKNKYFDDAKVLESAYETEKKQGLKSRYAYYCAQSYKDAGPQYKRDAIKWFKRHNEEWGYMGYKYCACINIGHLYKDLGEMENSLYYYCKSYEYDKERIEGISYVLDYYYNKGMHFMVHAIYEQFKKCGRSNKNLKIFLDIDRYKWMDYFNTVSSFYIKDFDSGYDSCKRSIKNNENYRNVVQNLIFYKDQLNNDNDPFLKKWLIHEVKSNFNTNYTHSKTIWEKYNQCIKIYDENEWNYLNKKFLNKSMIKKDEKYKKSKKILIYAGQMYKLWNHDDFYHKSLGGSERAIINLSNNLPKIYQIYIAGDVKEKTFGNIKYIHKNNLQTFIDNNEFHTVIVHRYACFFNMFENTKCYKLLLSLHDTHILSTKNDVNNILEQNISAIDNVVVLTNTHKKMISKAYPILNNKYIIINNGIDLTLAPKEVKKIKNKFIWSSCSERGLDILLNLWADLLKKIPDATLDICSYSQFPKNEADNEMQKIINKHDSITHRGKLNTTELYQLMAESEYWLYTCTWPETSCITGMEMLMNQVVCLYYPCAALVDTVAEYGIQIKNGNEIETLLNLTEKDKENMKQKGLKYAKACSWKSRAEQWTKNLQLEKEMNINNTIDTNLTLDNWLGQNGLKLVVDEIPKIGIFNGMFPSQHHELYGFIINYAKNNGYNVDIYYTPGDDLGWFDFYKTKFENVEIMDFMLFNWSVIRNYKYFFMPTDDDRPFSKDMSKPTYWPDNVICINHTNKIRTPGYKHYLNCANFKGGDLQYVYPCYNNMDSSNKVENKSVCIVGDRIYWNNNNIINRLYSKNKINLLIMGRKGESVMKDSDFNDKFNVSYYEDIDTTEMMGHLQNSSFVLMNFDKHDDHNTGETCSGSLQLALSNLCMPIMATQANKYLQIKNALEFDLETNEPIDIDENINFKAIEKERDHYVNKFQNYLDNLNIKSPPKLPQYHNKDIVPAQKNIALMMYGQFRNYKDNLANNIAIMAPILKDYKVNVFILTEKTGNYSLINEKEIVDIFEKWNFNVCFIKYVEDIDNNEEEKYYWDFLKSKKHNKGYANDFIPRLLYRRNYLVNNLVNEYTNEHDLNIDLAVYARLFDTKISTTSNVETIYKLFHSDNIFETTIFCSIDTIFIGKLGNVANTMNINNIFNDEIWNDTDFVTFCKQFESVLIHEKHTYSSEIQLLANMYYNNKKKIYKNIRSGSWNSGKQTDTDILYSVELDSLRYNFNDNNDKNKKETEETFTMIPKKIFQTWEINDIDPEFQKIIDIWKTKNPDYKYKFFNKDDRENFIKNNFDISVLNAYNKIIPGAFKCDLWRYCVLYIEGGVYVDIDTYCMGKLDNFIGKNDEFVVPIDLNVKIDEGQHNLACGFIASIPKSEILLKAINQIVYNVEHNIIPKSILDFCGPGMLGRSVNKYMKRSETESFIGKEGQYKHNCIWINFLKFDKKNEYIKNVNGDILFQNKNKNPKLVSLYENEIKKIKDYNAWTMNRDLSNIIESKKNWYFYSVSSYNNRAIIQYIKNLNNIYPDYNIKLVINPEKLIRAKKITFVDPFEWFVKNIINKMGDKIEYSFLNTEPLNLSVRKDKLIKMLNLYPTINLYDYSKSNIEILNNIVKNVKKTYLPYVCSNKELDKLKDFYKNTDKEYDFGILYGAEGDMPKRRLKAINSLRAKGYTINDVHGWDDDRDIELAKCKVILNLHGCLSNDNNEVPLIFEHIRCDRLLQAGYKILSEMSYNLDNDFINKYTNLKLIEYDEFLNINKDEIDEFKETPI